MRVAFLNVWDATSAEQQGGLALQKVGKEMGVEVVCCRNSNEAEACEPDFVLVLSRTQAKLTRQATYLCLNEPSSVYLREPGLYSAVMTFDGYFALADSLKQFIGHALYGIGRAQGEIPAYFNTAPRNAQSSAPVRETLMKGAGKLTYFGTNWDGRRSNFFVSIGGWDDAEIYGRKIGWEQWNLPNYKGEIPFDGTSVQDVYRSNGIGLNIQGDYHLQEDVISNRVFEITAAGAVCLSCRMPWLEKNFGDTLYYFDQNVSDKQLAESIRALLGHIRAHPDEAFEKAQAARALFEKNFALDVMLKNTIDFHQARQQKIKNHARTGDPLISVVMQSDGANRAGLARALRSIAAQERGRFQVVLVKTAPFDHETAVPLPPHVSLETTQAAASPLWHGLQKATGDYIALLDDACEWFPQHIARLLDASQGGHEFVHAALVTEGQGVAPDTAWIGNNERRRFTHRRDIAMKDYRAAIESINPFGFLAARKLFDPRLLENPQLQNGEREYLILCLMARARAWQNFASTVLLHEAEHKAIPLDLAAQTAVMMRLWRENPHTGAPNTFIEQLSEIGFRMRAARFETQREEKDGVIIDTLKQSRFDRARLQPMAMPWVRDQSFFHMGVTLSNDQQMTVTISTSETMRGLAGFIAFPQGEGAAVAPVEYLLIVDAEVERGQFGVQLLHNNRTLERFSVARTFSAGKRYRLEIPVYYRPEVSGLVIEVTPAPPALSAA